MFARIDAFRQRCQNMKQICLGQLQFAMKGNNAKTPVFGGFKGAEIILTLRQIKSQFQKSLSGLRGTNANEILIVGAGNWQDDYQ